MWRQAKNKMIKELYVETNIGRIPLDDYKEIVAMKYGFSSYADLRKEGYTLDIPEDIVGIENSKNK